MKPALLFRWFPPQKLEEDLPNHSIRLSWLTRPKTSLLFWLLGRAQGCFLSFEVKAAKLTLVLPRRTIEISREQLREATFSIGPEFDKLLLIRLRLRYQQGSQENTLQIPLWVESLNRRQEAMDLIFRIAQAWGLIGYQLSESSEALTISLLREVVESAEPYRSQAKAGVYRVPLLPGIADYKSDEAPPPPKRSAPEKKPFDWALLKERCIWVLLVIWYTPLWALVGIPGGVLVAMLFISVGLVFDLLLFGIGVGAPFSSLMNVEVGGYPLMIILTVLGMVLGFIWSVVTAVQWVRDEH